MSADRTFPPERVGARQRQRRVVRTRWRLPMAVVAVASLAGMALVAAPAQAQTALCLGTMTKTTVHSGLVVPDGRACELINVNVIGFVDVQEGADLLLTDSAMRNLIVRSDAFVFATGSMISNGVTMDQAFALQAFDSAILDEVVVTGGGAGGTSRLFTEGTHFVKDVRSTDGWTVLRDGQINGRLDTEGGRATDLFRMRIHGVSADATTTGSMICDSTIYGDLSVTGSQGILQLGGPFPQPDCPGNRIVGSMQVLNNIADDIQISSNQIVKDLTCTGNIPAPVGQGNIVFGIVSGQCDNLGLVEEQQGAQSLIPPPGTPGDQQAITEDQRVAPITSELAERELAARQKLLTQPPR